MQALLKAGGLTESDVNIRPVGLGGPALISQRQIDAYIWFRSQAMALQAKGSPVTAMDLDPHIPLPQDLMLATESNIEKRREALRGYLRVLSRVEIFGRDPNNEAEMDQHQAKYAPQTVQDTVFVRALSQEVRDRGTRDRAKNWRWGATDPARLEAAQDLLYELKVVDRKTPVEKMYTNELLPK
jgi:NitT/TauT family transport system substrate-binding protein